MMQGRKLVWREGMLMLPQHFQQLDVYHETLLHDRLVGLAPNAWGMVELSIDEQALAAGHFRLVRAQGFLPDGTPLQIGGADEVAPPSRPADAHVAPGRGSVGVYLAVPAHREHVPDLQEAGGAEPIASRFIADTMAAPDLNTAGNEQTLSFARPNAVLLFDGEALDGYDAIKIAEITRTPAGTLALRAEYVPPSLRIGASPFLMAGLRRLLGQAISRQKALATGRRERIGSDSVEFGAADVQAVWLLHTINSAIPPLAHALDTGWVSPETLYVELSRFAGQLLTFRLDGDPAAIPHFQFSDLSGTFGALFQLVGQLVGADVGDALTAIPLEQRQPGFYLGRIADSGLFERAAFYLAVGGDVPEATLRDRIPRLVKVGSGDQIAQIISAAMPGVRLEIDNRPPGAIPVRAGNIYLRLDKMGAYWDRIRSTCTIAIYQPLEPSRLKVELLAVPEGR